MTEPTKTSIDDETLAALRIQARQAGMSVPDYIARISRKPEAPQPQPWQSFFGANGAGQPPRRSSQEAMQDAMANGVQMMMFKGLFGAEGFGGNGHKGLDEAAVARIVRDELREREPRKPELGSGLREIMMPLVEVKMMKGLLGDEDGPLKTMLDRMEKETAAKLTALGETNEELRATLMKNEEDARAAQQTAMIEGLQEQVAALSARLQNPPTPPPTPGPIDQMVAMVETVKKAKGAFDDMRSAFGTPGGPPAPPGIDLEAIEKGLGIAADFSSRMLTSTAQYQAIKEGKGPVQTFDPKAPPQPPAGPAYSQQPPGAAPPQPPAQGAPPQPQAPAPGALVSFPPDTKFLDHESGQEISETQFREKYGQALAEHPEKFQVTEAPPSPRGQGAYGPINVRRAIPAAG